MTDQTPGSDTSNDQPAASAPVTAGKKPRSAVERVIVWGGIAVLLVVVGIEARARFGYQKTLQQLSAALADAENGSQGLILADFEQVIAGLPKVTKSSVSVDLDQSGKLYSVNHADEKSGSYPEVRYEWRSLFKTFSIRLTLTRDQKPEILSYETNTDQSNFAETMYLGSDIAIGQTPPTGDGAGMMPGGPPGGMPTPMGGGPGFGAGGPGGPGGPGFGAGGPGAGGPGGGEPRRSFEELDQNSDGKITKDEASERMQTFFDRMDANGDGGIEKSEFEEARSRFAAGGAGGGGPGGGVPAGNPDRPARPSLESEDNPAGLSKTFAPDATTNEQPAPEGKPTPDEKPSTDERPAAIEKPPAS